MNKDEHHQIPTLEIPNYIFTNKSENGTNFVSNTLGMPVNRKEISPIMQNPLGLTPPPASPSLRLPTTKKTSTKTKEKNEKTISMKEFYAILV